MADEPEVIRHQMEMQRASLAEKLDSLERQVTETVQGAKEAVTDTVATVKESVKDSVDTVRDTFNSSVESVKETFDLPLQVERHPWLMFGGAVATGFIGGLAVQRLSGSSDKGSSRRDWQPQRGTANYGTGLSTPAAAPAALARTSENQESWASGMIQPFAPELQKMKGLAIGAIMGMVRDLVSQKTPEPMRQQVTEVINGITTKLGGETVRGNVLEGFLPERANGR